MIIPLDLPPADPIAQLHRCFCRKLLERAVHTLIQPQSDSEGGKRKSDSGWGRGASNVFDSLMWINDLPCICKPFCSVSLSGSSPVPWSFSSYWTAVQRTLLPLLLPSQLLPITPPLQVWIAWRNQPCPTTRKHESHWIFVWIFLVKINQIAIWVVTVIMNGFSLLHSPYTDNQFSFWD